MYKFYDCLPNAGEMYLMFFICHTAAGPLVNSCGTAAGPLVNSCEWDCYWLENGALGLNLAAEFSVFTCMCLRYVYAHEST